MAIRIQRMTAHAHTQARSATPVARSNRTHSLLAAGACLAMWITVYVKVGSGLDFAINDYISRAQSLPELKVTGGPDDYRNWSILPLALDVPGRQVGDSRLMGG